jgi:Fe-S-cluster formation regulator IscX/YfhJ
LAPSDFHLFATVMEFFGGKHFRSNEEVLDAIKQWLNGLTAKVYDKGI